MVTSRDFHRPNGGPGYIVNLVRSFYFLGLEQLFYKLIKALVDQSRLYREQHFLKVLLDANSIWQALLGSAIGQRGLQLLAEGLIQQLAAKKKPIFSWCMPLAKFPRHPAVEEFLRGPRSSLVYIGVNHLKHARNFARKYFNGRYQDGYSAIGEEGGRGARAYCTITKTPMAFQELVLLWEKEQEELNRLRVRILQMDSTQARGAYRHEIVVLALDSNPHHDKKQKIDKTKYIDLTLDDE